MSQKSPEAPRNPTPVGGGAAIAVRIGVIIVDEFAKNVFIKTEIQPKSMRRTSLNYAKADM